MLIARFTVGSVPLRIVCYVYEPFCKTENKLMEESADKCKNKLLIDSMCSYKSGLPFVCFAFA